MSKKRNATKMKGSRGSRARRRPSRPSKTIQGVLVGRGSLLPVVDEKDDEVTQQKRALDAMVDAARERRPCYGADRSPSVDAFVVYKDAFGVGCRISWEGYALTFDVRGEVKHTIVRSPPGATRARTLIAVGLCTHVFMEQLVASVDLAWREQNIAIHLAR